MRGGSTRNRGPSGYRKGGSSWHIRDEAGTAGTSTSTRHRPPQPTIDDFFGPGRITQNDPPASISLDRDSLDGRKGHDSSRPDLHANENPASNSASDSASDIELPSHARAGIAEEVLDGECSNYGPGADGALSDGSSEWEDEPTETDAEEGTQDERNDGDKREGGSPGYTIDNGMGHQTRTDTDIYSSASGMKLVVVDCFEELFDPERDALDETRETQDAIDTGMDPRWAFVEAARAHRALKNCMHLEPGTVLYERLFTRLTSALIKAFEVGGTQEQQKCVFLREATSTFDVQVKGIVPEYYFDDLHLVPQLFHADLLVTKLVHKHIAHARWLQAPKPENLEGHTTQLRQWTRSGNPLVSGGGFSDRWRKRYKGKAKITAKNKGKHRHRSRRNTMLDKRGASRSVKNVSQLGMGESTSGSDSSQTQLRNATESRGVPSPSEGGSWSASDLKELEKSVPVYKARYSAIYAAIQSGAIPMQKKDRSQQILRSALISMKRRILQSDDKLPPGFDLIHTDKKLVRWISAAHKNPWRKEADVDDSGQPTNTEWDPAQDPALKLGPGRPQVMVAQGGIPQKTGAKVGLSANKRHDSFKQGVLHLSGRGHQVQPSPVHSSLARQGGTSQQQDQPAQQGQSANMQGIRRMVPSKTVKPGRRNRQHQPRL